jgi:hypothetical protein
MVPACRAIQILSWKCLKYLSIKFFYQMAQAGIDYDFYRPGSGIVLPDP